MADTGPSVTLDQAVRYAASQWDAAGRLATRAAGVVTLDGAALVGGITLLTGESWIDIGTKIAGSFFLGLSALLAGTSVNQPEWEVPPSGKSAAGVLARMARPADQVRSQIVADYLIASRANDGSLRKIQDRLNIATSSALTGIFILATCYYLTRVGI